MQVPSLPPAVLSTLHLHLQKVHLLSILLTMATFRSISDGLASSRSLRRSVPSLISAKTLLNSSAALLWELQSSSSLIPSSNSAGILRQIRYFAGLWFVATM